MRTSKGLSEQERLRQVEALEQLYPKVKVELNENLNLNEKIADVFKKVWYNKSKFRTTLHVAAALGITDRTVSRYRKKYECFKRTSF